MSKQKSVSLAALFQVRVISNFQAQYPRIYYRTYIITHEHDTNWVTMPNNVAYWGLGWSKYTQGNTDSFICTCRYCGYWLWYYGILVTGGTISALVCHLSIVIFMNYAINMKMNNKYRYMFYVRILTYVTSSFSFFQCKVKSHFETYWALCT